MVLVAFGVLVVASPAIAQVDEVDPDPTTPTSVDEGEPPTTVPDEGGDPGSTSTSTTDAVDEPSTTTSTSTPETTSTTAEPSVTSTVVDTTVPRSDSTPTTGVNPLLVAGPPDGRRQLTPDPTTAEGSDVDGADAQGDTAVETVATTDESDDAERVIRRVVIGLVAVAVLLAGLAVYYWWITRPPLLDDEADLGTGADSDLDPVPSERAGGDTVEPWLTDSTSTR